MFRLQFAWQERELSILVVLGLMGHMHVPAFSVWCVMTVPQPAHIDGRLCCRRGTSSAPISSCRTYATLWHSRSGRAVPNGVQNVGCCRT